VPLINIGSECRKLTPFTIMNLSMVVNWKDSLQLKGAMLRIMIDISIKCKM
jgi:hypothetical protein